MLLENYKNASAAQLIQREIVWNLTKLFETRFQLWVLDKIKKFNALIFIVFSS